MAEVESRFMNINKFLSDMFKLGFKTILKDQNREYFWLFDFKKVKDVKKSKNTPDLYLKPCFYKKR